MDDRTTAESAQAPARHEIEHGDLGAMRRLAEALALILAPGDVIALRGDLGAGKTTFARFLIHALSGGREGEVPSPTFSLLQTYETARGRICHFDFYRLSGEEETVEIGLDEALGEAICLIEWPERAEAALPETRLEIAIAEIAEDETGAAAEGRRIVLTGRGEWAERLERLAHLRAFLDEAGWGEAQIAHLQGDASTRRYARLARAGGMDTPDGPDNAGGGGTPERAILMDWPRQPDGPPIRDGKPYSAIAHLAEDVRPFVAVDRALRDMGLAAPALLAADLKRGFLLLEDLGPQDFRAALAGGADMAALWQAAVEVLLHVRASPPPEAIPIAGGESYRLPVYDLDAFLIEVALLTDWAVALLTGTPPCPDARDEFLALWRDLLAPLVSRPPEGWVLRDYHSPNLIWRPDRAGLARVGLVDFQDAVRGPLAYDLVSLLQDARVSVPPPLETALLDRYCAEARARETDFDAAAFRRDYAVLGAQRATKVLGIFARLALRDGKRAYLAHMPRVWQALERNLAHPALAALGAWYARHLPPALRRTPPHAGGVA